MGTDISVYRQCHIVPAHISAALTVRTVVELDVEQGVGIQALLRGNGIVLCFALHEGSESGFLCRADDLRVVPQQGSVDKLPLYRCGLGFRRKAVADKQGRAVIKADGYIACAAPFPRARRRFNPARSTAERLRDHPDFFLRGKRHVFLCDCGGFFLQVRKGFFGLLLLRGGKIGRGFLGFVLLLQLCDMSVNAVDDVCGGRADRFKGAFQLRKLPPAAPPGNIAERVVRCIKPVMLANGVGDAFRFHLAGAAVYAGLLLVFGSVQVNIVQLCVGDFVNGGFERLQLAHTLVKRDALVLQVIIAVCAALDFLKADGDGRGLFKGCEKITVLLHIARQRVHGNIRQFLSLGLGHVKDGHHLVGGYSDLLFLGDGLSVPADHGLLGLRVDFLRFLLDFERRRGDNLNAFFTFFDVALKLVFPSGKARDKGSIGLLHSDKQRVIEAVIMKLRHNAQILFVAFAVEQLRNALLQTGGNLLELFGWLLCGKVDRDNGLRLRRLCGKRRRLPCADSVHFHLFRVKACRLRCLLGRGVLRRLALNGITRKQQPIHLERLRVFFRNGRHNLGKQAVVCLDASGKVFFHCRLV